MSDFDREAERERLREKYERDKQKREASERMSELLLQGATMTNRHCSECHSPVFRYDGREFCPTCQREVDPEQDEAEAGGDTAEPDGQEPTETESEKPDRSAGGDTATEPTSADSAAQSAEASPDRSAPADQPADPEAGVDGARPGAQPGDQEPTDHQPEPDRATTSPSASGAGDPRRTTGDLAAAEASLVRTLADSAQQAEATSDVGRKRAYLAAAREAAETLAALRQA